jgi:uncharacterized protein YbbC (DUF1343 family)
MTQFGLDLFINNTPKGIKGKKVGVLCHAASVTSSYNHILEVLTGQSIVKLGAVFGPQHGLFGQTQDNMVEWEGGYTHPRYNVPVYSLYGTMRKPSIKMLNGLEGLIIDLQDAGARPYTYIWTVKLCMEACVGQNIPVWLLDRPNPIAGLPFDGPILREDFFTFVGGATIPLCHRMTMGEMATLLKQHYFPSLELHVIWMKEWWRDSLYHETGLPWVIPSPNMPTENTAIVYPGMVLFEATNLSEGRGTTLPFELFGAPFINGDSLLKELGNREIPGCAFREHNFIPTFQKWQGEYCQGIQIHVKEPRSYRPVFTAASIIDAVIKISEADAFAFKDPPYEYEFKKMPFDILSGDTQLRQCLTEKLSLEKEQEKWQDDIQTFEKTFHDIAYYPEKKI